MTSRNPIDNFFRRRLEHYEQEAPMHLWSTIDQRRSGLAASPAKRRYALLFPLLLLLGFSGLLLQDQPSSAYVRLSNFPIPASPASQPGLQHQPVSPASPAPVAEIRHTTTESRAMLPVIALSDREEPMSALPSSAFTTVPASPVATSEALSTPSAMPPVPVLASLSASPLPVPQDRELQCVRFGNGGAWRLYADLTIGPAIGLRDLKARSEQFNGYADARRSTESPLLSYTAGLRLSLVTNFNVALRSGLQFTQLNEKFDYLDSNQEKVTITTVFGANGEIIGTDTLIEKSIRREVARNRYRMVDIPLLLGYEFHHGKWTFALNGGALVNLMFRAQGSFLDPDTLRPVAFSPTTPNDAPPYRTDIGLGWYAGLGLHYNLPNGLQLLVEPHLRHNPSSVTQEAYGLEQRYLTGGLSVGLRKQI